ncbi:collagen alpha-1(I) chain-like [Phalacrocorax carbo]|uniref:collagen alpha-1(I) chain-like n=1 Tax=Phalacrocorax carbo TaxID=9209 RepID=UPI00311962F7
MPPPSSPQLPGKSKVSLRLVIPMPISDFHARPAPTSVLLLPPGGAPRSAVPLPSARGRHCAGQERSGPEASTPPAAARGRRRRGSGPGPGGGSRLRAGRGKLGQNRGKVGQTGDASPLLPPLSGSGAGHRPLPLRCRLKLRPRPCPSPRAVPCCPLPSVRDPPRGPGGFRHPPPGPPLGGRQLQPGLWGRGSPTAPGSHHGMSPSSISSRCRLPAVRPGGGGGPAGGWGSPGVAGDPSCRRAPSAQLVSSPQLFPGAAAGAGESWNQRVWELPLGSAGVRWGSAPRPCPAPPSQGLPEGRGRQHPGIGPGSRGPTGDTAKPGWPRTGTHGRPGAAAAREVPVAVPRPGKAHPGAGAGRTCPVRDPGGGDRLCQRGRGISGAAGGAGSPQGPGDGGAGGVSVPQEPASHPKNAGLGLRFQAWATPDSFRAAEPQNRPQEPGLDLHTHPGELRLAPAPPVVRGRQPRAVPANRPGGPAGAMGSCPPGFTPRRPEPRPLLRGATVSPPGRGPARPAQPVPGLTCAPPGHPAPGRCRAARPRPAQAPRGPAPLAPRPAPRPPPLLRFQHASSATRGLSPGPAQGLLLGLGLAGAGLGPAGASRAGPGGSGSGRGSAGPGVGVTEPTPPAQLRHRVKAGNRRRRWGFPGTACPGTACPGPARRPDPGYRAREHRPGDVQGRRRGAWGPKAPSTPRPSLEAGNSRGGRGAGARLPSPGAAAQTRLLAPKRRT